MPLLHDPSVHSSILARLNGLRADTPGRWGKMTVGQMLWHVNEALESMLGRVELTRVRPPLPKPVLRFMVLNAPWPKGAPTNPRFVATATTHEFNEELVRCRRLIGEVVHPMDDLGLDHPVLGRLSGRDHSRLHAKHLDHHLRQFGV